MNLAPADLFYVQVKPEDVPDIVNDTLGQGKVVERLLYRDNGTRYRSAAEVPFYKLQQKIILKNVGVIDPLDINDTLAGGAYSSLGRALTHMSGEEIIETVTVSGLRGRGGGGFPTGFKVARALDHAQEEPGPLILVGDGDEGDPGAFMDRSIMEGDPHAVLEGMAIGAYALGADRASFMSAASIPLRCALFPSPSSRPGASVCWAAISWAPALTSTSRSTGAPGPSSAAKRRPFWPPSRAGRESP